MSLQLSRVLGRLHDDAIHAQQQEASKKRQGTKSREVGHPTLRRRLASARLSRPYLPWSCPDSAPPRFRLPADGGGVGSATSAPSPMAPPSTRVQLRSAVWTGVTRDTKPMIADPEGPSVISRTVYGPTEPS